MKKIAFILTAGILVFTACKKKTEDVVAPTTCELTTAGITGSYKATKIEYTTGGGGYIDVTSGVLDACERDDTYNFNANGVFVYTDAGTTCSPNGSGTGTWSVTSGKLTCASASISGIDLSSATLSDNKCTSFIATETSSGYRVTFTK
jgi:Lipocalin-like domain